jgi:hypothetical protein
LRLLLPLILVLIELLLMNQGLLLLVLLLTTSGHWPPLLVGILLNPATISVLLHLLMLMLRRSLVSVSAHGLRGSPSFSKPVTDGTFSIPRPGGRGPGTASSTGRGSKGGSR